MSKTAYFDPRGCDFWADEPAPGGSDVGNYRLVTCVVTKDGNPTIIEFGGYKRKEQYTTNRGTTKWRVANENALHIDGQCEAYREPSGNFSGGEAISYRPNFETKFGIHENEYSYMKADILRFLSDITGEEYTEFVFDCDKVDEQIKTIYEPVEKANWDKVIATRERIEAEKEERHRIFLENWRKKRDEMNG